MLLASVTKSASLLLVQCCLLLLTSFFVSDVAAWQAYNPNPVTTAYLLDLSYYHSLLYDPLGRLLLLCLILSSVTWRHASMT